MLNDWHLSSISDLQTVNITLRVLFRPRSSELPKIFTTLGIDYEDRVLPSITNEVLKAVVVSKEMHLYVDTLHRAIKSGIVVLLWLEYCKWIDSMKII